MRRYGIDVKGIMSNDAVVIVGAGQAALKLAVSLKSGGYIGSIDMMGAERHLSKTAQLRRRTGHRTVTPTAPHSGTGG
jgi:hypothetical protein